ncbi:TraX family protein [Cohnella sp.]|uniref:TraX family protein n=1 Tax=Cohnella sp. TaxID=1883426 RepID=UPI0035656617
MITMLIDHVGFIFYPKSEILRIIGRIAFPLYGWFLVQGYRHTRNHKKYMLRLLGLACISQIPYTLAFQQFELNVIFTLLLSLLSLYAADQITSKEWKAVFILIVAATSFFIPMDYGLYGVLLIFIFRYFEGWKVIANHSLLNIIFLTINGPGYWIQLFSVFGTALIVYPLSYQSIAIHKWIYRYFYPAHLAILYGLYVWLH